MFNFEATFKNKFEKGDWEFILRVGATIVIEQIDPFHNCLQFVPTHSILDFMQKANLEELGTTELVVIGIYGRSAKAFIMVVADGLSGNDAHALSFYLEFFAQYMQLVKMYRTGNLATMLVKHWKLLVW